MPAHSDTKGTNKRERTHSFKPTSSKTDCINNGSCASARFVSSGERLNIPMHTYCMKYVIQTLGCIEHVCIGIFSLSPVGTNQVDVHEPLSMQSVNVTECLR